MIEYCEFFKMVFAKILDFLPILKCFKVQGAWVDGSIQGAGKYIFELGCEQHGEYIPVELPGDPEDDEAGSTTIPKWKAVKVTPITLPK